MSNALEQLKLIESAEQCQQIILENAGCDDELAVGIINREVSHLMAIIRGLMPETQDIYAWREIQDRRSKAIEELLDWLTERETGIRERDKGRKKERGILEAQPPELMCETTKLWIRHRLTELFQQVN